ncbi:CynX/NimT family MFS transporter [Caryophanon tenue]|uniref:Transporter n=1 Tax=Caryophanon tenue TaxID=33978 RepID=A0A1C0YNH5_9BACL|nr:MFS transporter [Caryophanon tenue]OCS88730.1 transporter [Caryophanon tenue]
MKNQKTYGLFALVAIFFVSINLRPAVTSVGPLLNTIADDLSVSSTQMSLLTSIPVFCMGLFASLAMPLTKRFGDRMAITLLMVLIGVATIVRIFVPSYGALIVTSFFAGVGIAAIAPIMSGFIKKHFPQKTASVIGLHSFGIGFGATISAGFTTVFFDWSNAWTFALGIWGVLAAVAIVIWMMATKGGNEQVGTVTEAVAQEGRNPWKTKRAWMLLLFFGVQTSLFFSMTTWLAPIAQEEGFTLATAGLVLTVMSIVQLFGNLTIPAMLDKYPNRMAWITGLTAVALVGGILMWIGGTAFIWAGAMLIGLAMSGLFPIGILLPLDDARNDKEANEWSSMVMSGGFMMSAIIPLVIGVLYDVTGTHDTSVIMILVQIILLFALLPFMKQKEA